MVKVQYSRRLCVRKLFIGYAVCTLNVQFSQQPKHPKRKLFRASEPLLSVFMWGVNHTVKELEHVEMPVMLMPDDFRAFSKIKVDNHAFNKENLPSHFKVKEYCPLVFRNLRDRFGLEASSFLKSLTYKAPKPKDNPGKSGAKFYLSHVSHLKSNLNLAHLDVF